MLFWDVTAEYVNKDIFELCKIEYEKSYHVEKHKEEIKVAKWLIEKFGGKIVLCDEVNHKNEKYTDYIWNGKMWNLKGISSAKAANSAIRKGVLQVIKNPGGIILELKKDDIKIDEVMYYINDRMRRISNIQIDIMLKKYDMVVKIVRYKKIKRD